MSDEGREGVYMGDSSDEGREGIVKCSYIVHNKYNFIFDFLVFGGQRTHPHTAS